MEHEDKKKPVWAIILSPIGVILLTIFLLIGGLGVLAFGNCQWNRWIYVFQAYYYPKYENGFISPSKKYKGSWNDWYKNGQQKSAEIYDNWNFVGHQVYWYENGNLKYKKNWKNHMKDGQHTDWYKSGIKKQETNWEKGKLHGLYNKWNDKGKLKKRFYYRYGFKLKEETLDPKTGKMVVTFEKK